MSDLRSLTNEAVVWAFRILLGREPENREVVEEKVASLADRTALLADLVGSVEFRRRNLGLPLATANGSEPPIRIDLDIGESELEKLFIRTSEIWNELGKTDPHWSVITLEKYRKDQIAQSEVEFHSSGERQFETVRSTLARNGLEMRKEWTCLELGSGVGRVSRPLSFHFNKFIGYDISEAHLAHARNLRLENAEFRHLERVIDLESLPEFDFFYSFITLQHNPPPLIEYILKMVFRKLNREGVAFFQVPTYRSNYEFNLNNYLNSEYGKSNMEMHYLPQCRIFELLEANGLRVVQVFEDSGTGRRFEEVSNTFLVQKK